MSPKCPHFGKEEMLHIYATTQQHRSTRVTLVIGSHAHQRRPWLNSEVGVWKLSHLHTPASYLIIHLLCHTAGERQRETDWRGEAVNKRGKRRKMVRRRRECGRRQQNSQTEKQTLLDERWRPSVCDAVCQLADVPWLSRGEIHGGREMRRIWLLFSPHRRVCWVRTYLQGVGTQDETFCSTRLRDFLSLRVSEITGMEFIQFGST